MSRLLGGCTSAGLPGGMYRNSCLCLPGPARRLMALIVLYGRQCTWLNSREQEATLTTASRILVRSEKGMSELLPSLTRSSSRARTCGSSTAAWPSACTAARRTPSLVSLAARSSSRARTCGSSPAAWPSACTAARATSSSVSLAARSSSRARTCGSSPSPLGPAPAPRPGVRHGWCRCARSSSRARTCGSSRRLAPSACTAAPRTSSSVSLPPGRAAGRGPADLPAAWPPAPALRPRVPSIAGVVWRTVEQQGADLRIFPPLGPQRLHRGPAYAIAGVAGGTVEQQGADLRIFPPVLGSAPAPRPRVYQRWCRWRHGRSSRARNLRIFTLLGPQHRLREPETCQS